MANHPPALAYARSHGLRIPPVPGMSDYERIHGVPDPRPARNLTTYIARTPPSPGFDAYLNRQQNEDGDNDGGLPDCSNVQGPIGACPRDGDPSSDDSFNSLFHSDGSNDKFRSSPPRQDTPQEGCTSDSFVEAYHDSADTQMAVTYDSGDWIFGSEELETHVLGGKNNVTECEEGVSRAVGKHGIYGYGDDFMLAQEEIDEDIRKLEEKVKTLEKENEQLKEENKYLAEDNVRLRKIEKNHLQECVRSSEEISFHKRESARFRKEISTILVNLNASRERQDVKYRQSSLQTKVQDTQVKTPRRSSSVLLDTLPVRPASDDRKRKPKSPVTAEVETPARRAAKKKRTL
ncbi:uncharacterized protein BDZ99DRAFT_575194 [Mytilinidion resinicola]|uniref:Uncharacterized protein n=1 Tax=Mytilinidion resinicola TaxID=574789 RepID=A0A6A6Y762_9PEZI|nr:uncharacterized protein BDZ99DRAFT_575194 [Mytilinidion resinicola]KAF2804530.1 hypothetical protein BDZ99DRAFT_575194 [Mytilinidion resinicola]